jgi:hypothetical protein
VAGGAPAPAAAFDWNARAGLIWTGTENTGPGASTSATFTDLDLGLKLRLDFINPQTAYLVGGFDYRFYDHHQDGYRLQRIDTYTYDVYGAFFQHRRSPLQLTWGLTRVDADLAGPGGKWFGERTSDSGRVGARFELPALPTVSAGYSWFDSTDRYGDGESHDRNVQRGTATLGHSTPVFSFALQYAGEWSAGNWAGDDYQLDTIYTEGTARLGGTATFTVSDQYYQRTPTSTFATALTSDFHSLQATLRDLPSLQEEQFVRYVYARSLQSVPSQPTLETEQQRLDLQREFKLASEYSLRPQLALSLVEQRNGTTGSRTTGEWATVYFRWLRRGGSATYDLQAGPVVGFLQDDQGTSSFGHGVTANGTVTLPLWDGFTGGGNYALSYSNNLGGAQGWALGQVLSLFANGPLWSGQLGAQFLATAGRTWTPVFGDFASRNLRLDASWTLERFILRGSIDVGSGIAGNPTDLRAGDGLFVPLPFDSNAVFSSLGAQASTLWGLTGSINGRYGTSSAPGQPALTQYGADASISYALPAFSVGIEDRYNVYDAASGRSSTNMVQFRIFRGFGNPF